MQIVSVPQDEIGSTSTSLFQLYSQYILCRICFVPDLLEVVFQMEKSFQNRNLISLSTILHWCLFSSASDNYAILAPNKTAVIGWLGSYITWTRGMLKTFTSYPLSALVKQLNYDLHLEVTCLGYRMLLSYSSMLILFLALLLPLQQRHNLIP